MSARILLTIVCAVACGFMLNQRFPFPQSSITELVRLTDPQLHMMLRGAWVIALYTTPAWCLMGIFALVHVFVGKGKGGGKGKLGPFPFFRASKQLQVVLGERWHRRLRRQVPNPEWVTMGERGLYTGTMIIGAIGSGKTSCLMYPLTRQILTWQSSAAARRIGGLVLEVKGDFCYQVKKILEECGRKDDYIELGLQSKVKYNPLHADADAFALAFSIGSAINLLYGKSKEPFWQQAYINLIKFVILLHRIVDGHVTLFQVYVCVTDQEVLMAKMAAAEKMYGGYADPKPAAVIDPMVYLAHGEKLGSFKWETRPDKMLATAITDEVQKLLDELLVPYQIVAVASPDQHMKERVATYMAVVRWYKGFIRMRSDLRTSIPEGVKSFLSHFDTNADLKRVFCPSKEEYESGDNKFPSFEELIETGKVLALNFPVALDPATARLIAVLLKADYQRAMLSRIPKMAADPQRHWRPAVFVADEYHMLATVGATDPSGDERFFSLSRQALCIPIVATQSISSLVSALGGDAWRTLLQTFRTKVFLGTSDRYTAEEASKICGEEQRWVPTESVSESSQDAHPSRFSGRLQGDRSSVSTSRSRNLQSLPIFNPVVFTQLKTAEAIALVFDGVNPHPASRLFLKPGFLDVNLNYFQQSERGLL